MLELNSVFTGAIPIVITRGKYRLKGSTLIKIIVNAALLLAGLTAKLAVIAATNGQLSSNESIGKFEVSLNHEPTVRVSALSDIRLTENRQGDLQGSTPICVYAETGHFQLSLDTENQFLLKASSHQSGIPYILIHQWGPSIESWGTAGTDNAAGSFSGHFAGNASTPDSSVCDKYDRMIKVLVRHNFLSSRNTGHYRDTVYVTVRPV